MADFFCDPVLLSAGFVHGFGQRGSQAPESTAFSRQVHGVEVVEARAVSGPLDVEADVVLSAFSGVSVGIVTADCVPILAASQASGVVVAIHAGWRGLAAGVIERGLDALRARSGQGGWVAAVGPAARGCCYEVDEPVQEALAERYARHLDGVLVATLDGHYLLDLPVLATRILLESGLEPAQIGTTHRVCTICDPDRFESYRRDGPAAGRLRHFISHA